MAHQPTGLVSVRLKSLIRQMVMQLIPALSYIAPRSKHVVVHGFPDSEGNSLRMVVELCRDFGGKVIWLRDDDAFQWQELGALIGNVECVKKRSLQGFVAYLRAPTVFFTHGLYGNPRPSRRQVFVNLWHGDGPKLLPRRVDGSSATPSTFVVGSTELFTRRKAVDFDVVPENALVTGNPRTDFFFETRPPGALRTLGIEPEEPFVIWMPTFRTTRVVGATASWSDAHDPAYGKRRAMEYRALVDSLRSHGVHLVVKPHPMDSYEFNDELATVISTADLDSANLPLYSLIAASDGMVTDYSSVWVDYLLLDKPMAFQVSDAIHYREDRGLFPDDVLDWLPGTALEDPEDYELFALDVAKAGALTQGKRQQAIRRLGMNMSRTATADLLSELRARGVLAS